jgi:hypothetical protein
VEVDVTDPEEVQPIDREELFEREADVVDPLERPVPVEAPENDVIEQRLDVPVPDDDEELF